MSYSSGGGGGVGLKTNSYSNPVVLPDPFLYSVAAIVLSGGFIVSVLLPIIKNWIIV